MIFFMGLNGVASTTIQAKETAQNPHSTASIMPCHDAQKIDQTHQMHMPHSDHVKHMKCHDGQIQNDLHCQDCNSPSHCQTVNLTLHQHVPTLAAVLAIEQKLPPLPDYRARHLAGYWQQILRPPKT